MTDIVDLLRGPRIGIHRHDILEAADEIEWLRERITVLESSEKYLAEKITRMRKKERLEIHEAVEQLREK